MKTRFLLIRLTKKFIFKMLLLLLIICVILILIVAAGFFNNFRNLEDKTIGIDPGHGGYDPGFCKDEIRECDIVLDISLKLRRLLEQGGARVIMTRDEDEDLWDYYSDDNGNQDNINRVHDLDNRVRVIEDNEADVFLSVHANTISSSIWRGAQTFYQDGDDISRSLAYNIQDRLIETLKNTDRTPLVGDYYVLRQSIPPGVIVEVGFLSNPLERELLQSNVYQERIAWAIYLGLLDYISEN